MRQFGVVNACQFDAELLQLAAIETLCHLHLINLSLGPFAKFLDYLSPALCSKRSISFVIIFIALHRLDLHSLREAKSPPTEQRTTGVPQYKTSFSVEIAISKIQVPKRMDLPLSLER
jgi:hypothetical protein